MSEPRQMASSIEGTGEGKAGAQNPAHDRQTGADMNEPSKEAQEAAEQLEAEWDIGKTEQIIQQAIDAATAKLLQQAGDQERLANDMMLERDGLARELETLSSREGKAGSQDSASH